MKKNTPPKNTKKDFEKVYENPLDWCPLFGYLPDVKEYGVCHDKIVLETIEACMDLINSCRDNFGFDYRPTLHMKKYVCLPDAEIIFPSADDDVISYLKSLRRLFQNLDFLSLKSASLYDHNEALVNAINISHKTIRIDACPIKPMGRVSNNYYDGLGVIAEDIRLDRVFWRDLFLLVEANKFSGEAARLDNIKLISLYAILEAWLIVTRLLLKPKHDKEDLLFHMERLVYAKELENIAEHHKDNQHLSRVYDEKNIIERIAEPYRKVQSGRGIKSAAARNKKAKPKKEAWVSKSDELCKNYFENGKYHLINVSHVARRIDPNKFNTIRQDDGVKAKVAYWEEKIKGDKAK